MANQPRRKRPRRRGRGRDRSVSNGTSTSPETHAERRTVEELCVLGPFSVFCALYLGITRHDGYADQDTTRVARQFGLSRDELEQFLEDHQLTASDLAARKFDLEGARLDIKVAPAGISRVELARPIFEELLYAESA